MPGKSKTRWAQLKVGLMALVAFALLTFLIFLMAGKGGFFKSTSHIYTYLDDSAAISEGAPVRLNGVLIGKVVASGLSGLNEPNRIIKVDMEVYDEFLPAIPVDSEAAIAAENLLGTKYINIKKGKNTQAIKALAEIKSLDTREFDEVVQQGYSAISGLNGIIQKVNGIVDQIQVGKGSIGKLLVDETLYNRLLGIVDEGNKLAATLNSDQGTLGKLLHNDELYQDVRGSIVRINTLVDGINKGEGTAGKLMKDPALYDESRKAIADVREMLAGINRGEGTVGKLLKSDEMHKQIAGTITKLDAILEKVNSGDGTIGQLMNNPSMYESMDGTTRELQGMLRDFRANPKKYLTIQLKLF